MAKKTAGAIEAALLAGGDIKYRKQTEKGPRAVLPLAEKWKVRALWGKKDVGVEVL